MVAPRARALLSLLVGAALGLCLPRPAVAQLGVGSWEHPFQLDAFPFAHGDDTTTGVEMADRYGCAADLDESGPEVVYAFTLEHPARVTAWVEGDIDGVVDVDVHLLDSDLVVTGEASCLDRGHRVAEAILPAGDGWVVVDTFVDGGVALAGPYVLRVDVAVEEAPGRMVIEREVAQGVLWRQEVHEDLFGGAQTVNLLEVDLTHPEVIVAPRMGDGCETTGSIGRRELAVAAVNGGFFGPGCSPVGLVRVDDALLASNPADRPPRSALGLDVDGRAVVRPVAADDPFDEVRHALGGLPGLVTGGVADVRWSEEAAGESFTTARHPRTAACVTGDDYLLFVTLDGRTSAGLGVDLFDLADFLVSLGCDRGLNYDGGGSTALWVWPEVGPGVASYPSDNGEADHLGQRAVSNAWVVWAAPTNRPPRFITEPPLSAADGVAWSYDAEALDLDLDLLTYALSEAPAGMTVDATEGQLFWTPTYRQGGPWTVVLSVVDDFDVTEQRFEVVVSVADADVDGLPDQWEHEVGTDPARDDAEEDPDGDGRTNAEEYAAHSDPFHPDSAVVDGDADGDGDGDIDADADGDGDGDPPGGAEGGCGCAAVGRQGRALALVSALVGR